MKIALHREINRLSIYFENEIMVNCFIGILKEFNHFSDNGIIEMSKKELLEISGIKEPYYREETVRGLIKELTKSGTYEIKDENKILSGSVFIIAQNGDNLKIEIPQLMQPYIFTKIDKEIITKADKKERLTTKELDYWDRTLREKSKELVLLEEAEVLGVKGQYAKRLYMLLKPFENTGYFVMSIEKFREVMQVPLAYSLAIMNRDVIKKSKAVLEKKEIFKFRDEPTGKGRRVIEKIEIKFEAIKSSKVVKKAVKKSNLKKEKEEIQDDVKLNLTKETLEFREKARKKGEKLPTGKKFEFLARIIPLRTVESIKELCMEFEIKI